MNKPDVLAYTLDQAASAINVSRLTMLRIVRREDFPAMKVGKKWLIPVRPFELWLEKQANAPQNMESFTD